VSGARDWDAATYERVSNPQFEWGMEVLDRLPLEGDERVLDAGCGSGRVTAAVRERLPRGSVLAVDASPSMVEQARAALGEDRVEYEVADLAELTVDEPVDAVISTACFHWIPDHDRLFARLHAALRPGGRIEAQCGGEGNIGSVRRALEGLVDEQPWARHLGGWAGPWNFAGPDETRERLVRAGFEDVSCWLESKVMRTDEPEAWLSTVTCGSHLDRLPQDLRHDFISAVVGRLENPGVHDYVRLNISARRAG
jgi:trans-aconitate 2-methyltransferase